MSVHLPLNVVSVNTLGSEPTNLPENSGFHLPWKLRQLSLQTLTSVGPLKRGGRYCFWIAVLPELQFFRYLSFWVPLFMQYKNFWRVHTWKQTLVPIFSVANFAIILNIVASKSTRSLQSALLKVVIEASVV